jgi:ribosomal protein S18 acetylase RimI-like enzyme
MALSSRPITEADIPHVVRLHQRVMGYSVNARLGNAHLAFVYRATAALPDALVCVAEDDGVVVGAVSASLDEAVCARALVRQMGMAQRITTAVRLCCTPSVWPTVWAARRSAQPVIHDGASVAACLTSIVVAPDAQGRGIGRTLIATVDAFMRAHGLQCYRLDTRVSNRGARAFYTRLGFCEFEQRGCDIIFIRQL